MFGMIPFERNNDNFFDIFDNFERKFFGNSSANLLVGQFSTLMAPADWPNTVIRSGSPPKAAMLSRTQRSAAIWSEVNPWDN